MVLSGIVPYLSRGLGFGIVIEEVLGGTIEAYEVLESFRHLGFRGHRETSSKLAGGSHIKLHHGASTVSRNSIIESRCIRKDGVSGNSFFLSRDVCTQKTRFIVSLHGKAAFSLIPLCCTANSVANS